LSDDIEAAFPGRNLGRTGMWPEGMVELGFISKKSGDDSSTATERVCIQECQY
jgi:hypothetical protein